MSRSLVLAGFALLAATGGASAHDCDRLYGSNYIWLSSGLCTNVSTGDTRQYGTPGTAAPGSTVIKQRLDDLTSRTSTLETRVNSADQRLNDIAGQLGSTTTTTNNNTTRIDALEGRVTNNTTNITNNTTNIANNSTKIDELRGRVDGNTTQINEHTTQITNNTTQINSNKAEIDDLRGQVDANTAEIDKLKKNAGQQQQPAEAQSDSTADAQEMRDELRSGVAVALSLPGVFVPEGKSFALMGNVGIFEGETAVGLSGAARVTDNVFVSAGIGTGLDSDVVGGRAGVMVAW